LKRIPVNRVITLQVTIYDDQDLTVLNEVVRWINAQEQKIKLQFKVNFDVYGYSLEKLSKFLNSINIIELNDSNHNTLSLNDTLYHSLRCLKISDSTIIDL
jgi:CRISPR/Cas system-associated protein endoribonuclease Cas2